MDNPNMWHIRDQIFDPLNHETVLICRQVCQFWNESLARMSFVKRSNFLPFLDFFKRTFVAWDFRFLGF